MLPKGLSIYKRSALIFSGLIIFCCISSCKKDDSFIVRKPQAAIRATDKRFSNELIKLVKDTVYVIATDLVIKRGQTLLIEAGTLLKVNNNFGLRVEPGGKIEAAGTLESPIVFTSSANKGSQGVVQTSVSANSWKGIEMEGEAGKSSGTLKYLRIEFAGNRSVAGLYLKNVDSTTSVNYVQVSFTYSTPGFLFSGGNCQAKYLYGYCNAGSDFELSGGYTGKLQFIAAHRHPFIPFEIIGNNLSGIVIRDPGTWAFISNASVIGPDNQAGTTSFYNDTTVSAGNRYRKSGLVVYNIGRFRISNSSFAGFPQGAFILDSRESAASLNAGESLITHSVFHANNNNRVFYLPPDLFPGLGSNDLKDLLLSPQFANTVFTSTNEIRIMRPYDFENPDLLPVAGSPLLTGANFINLPFNDPFFEKISFKGAFGAGNWLNGWVNFTPLQTNYNN